MKKSLPPTWLVGRKVRLRAVEPEDASLLARLNRGIDSSATAFIIQTLAGRAIGIACLSVHGNRGAVGLRLLARRDWATGFAQDALRVLKTGAFRSMPLARIEALVAADDGNALRAYRRAGFAREGVLRQTIRARGGYVDGAVMSAIPDG